MVGFARTYDVIGKARNFVSVDGNLWLCGRERAGHSGNWVTGGTIACWAERCPEYTMDKAGEDVRFCDRAMSDGLSVYATSIHHYLYRRTGGSHTWGISNEKLRGFESSLRSLDLGLENLEIVTGELLEVQASPLAPAVINRRYHGIA